MENKVSISPLRRKATLLKKEIEKLENEIANIKDVLDVQDEPEDDDIEDDDQD